MLALICATRKTNIAHHTNQTPAFDENSKTLTPSLIEFIQKVIVIFNVTHLLWLVPITLQGPIWRRSENKMNALVGYKREISCVVPIDVMCCGNFRNLRFYIAGYFS